MATLRWIVPDGSADQAAEAIARELKLHPIAARVLASRGYQTVEAAKDFLDDGLSRLPDPFRMKGMPAAVKRISQALAQGEKITLWGDYDVDGVSSTALLSLFLRELGGVVATTIPHRLEQGYGLNSQGIERIAKDGTRVLITLDCGITSHAEVALAGARGLDVIVVDHHAVPETMPPALAVLNPLQPGCDYPTRHLCAGGVTFNLCMGLRKTLRDEGRFNGKKEPNLRAYLDLVALATIADVVPLTGANRILVRHGLAELTRGARPGVQALKEVSGLTGETITAGHVGFGLGPRINAAGRLDDASVGLRCLTAPSIEEAMPLARALDSANQERRLIERSILESAIMQAAECVERGAKGLVLYSEDWHPGVVGIVASRVVERFCRPTVMVGVHEGLGRGSARSVEGFHLYDALKQCSGRLRKFGGHKHAAGLSIDPGDLAAFRAEFETVAGERLEEKDLIPRCRVDAVVQPAELDEAAIHALEGLAPFGCGNPTPVFAVRRQVTHPRVLASKKEGEQGHLKLRLEANPQLDVIGFRLAEKLPLTEGPVDLAFQLELDEWQGRNRVSLKLKDLRASA
jgi:single-stranded-DNA-specific exonuclease